MSKLATTAKSQIDNIANLAKMMATMPQMEAPVTHHFSDGVYVREIFMPKGMIIVGKIHKTRHLNIIQQGRCLVVTPTRKLEVRGPATFESHPGEQKVVYMLEDTVWSTVHVTDSKDLVEIEEHCISNEYDEDLVQQLLGSFGG